MTTFGNRTMERAPGEVCLQCGTKLSSLFPTCLWCSSSSQLTPRASISNPNLALQGGPLHGPRNTELSLVNPLSPSQPSTSKTLRRAASHQPTPHLSVDLKDESESLMDALSSTFPSLLKQEKGEKQVKHIQPDRDASMRPMEGSNVAMLRPSVPSSSEAGSSTSTSTPAPGLQSRSRSLFTLTPSSRPSEEATTTTSTTSSIMTVARSITRRLSSSTTLRAQPMADHDVAEGKKHLHSQDHDDVFEGSGRTLSRKKRLQSPVAVHPPAQIGSGLSKKVSRTSLSSPPIAISLRPSTADSSTSSRRDPSPGGEEREATPKVAPSAPPTESAPLSTSAPAQETRGIRWSIDDERDAAKCKSNGTPILKSGGDDSLSRTTSRSPTNSVTSSTASIPRLGHPSRPYYSAIRKHCMSSPAASSRPSVDQSLAPPVPTNARARPTSTSVPPSAFNMTSITPFTRRPVSIGVVPVSAPATGSSSRPGSMGISAFDISDDALEEVEEPKPRKSSSLSRAFGRRNSQEPGKKRRMSATLFSDSGPKDAGKRQSDVAEATQAFRALNMGISMSGETEMRMALAAMQQQEEQAASEHVEGGSSIRHAQGQADTSSQRKYRFRQTMDLSGTGAASGAVASPVDDDGAEGKPKKKTQENTVLKKLKRGLKGLLK